MQHLSSLSNLVETDLRRVQRSLGIDRPPQLFPKQLEGQDLLAGCLDLNGLELLLLFGDSYPTTPPILLATLLDRDTEQLELRWSLNTPPEERLITAMQRVLHSQGYHPKLDHQKFTKQPSKNCQKNRSFSFWEWFLFGG
ncbi:hypothetical protein [Lyngbya sp. CCY1209]|uniref:hypothetical protein n=1 Tax=Lyngbya sp. CCY1209 TaxID=2886103 RepID=UPI002D201247|nr:hypothetical protein [Lyngbya sp. CCY1209]MEB3883395.1 hypothetical protein [Lyngbya sp. CCY1209]